MAQSMIVTVPNRSPVTTGSIPAQTVAEGETTTVDVSPYFRDPDDETHSASVLFHRTPPTPVSPCPGAP